MILDEKHLAEIILYELKSKNELKYKYVTQKDIERIIRFFIRTIVRFSVLGYTIVLPVYKNRKKDMSIIINPIERKIVQRQFKAIIGREYHKKRTTPL